MKKVIYIMLLLAFMGCKQEEIPTYSGAEYVQFDNEGKMNLTYSFVYAGKSAVLDTVYINVRIAGPVADHDRKVSLKQVTEWRTEPVYDEEGIMTDTIFVKIENQAIAGVHYVPFDDPSVQNLMYLKAGESKGRIGVVLKRTVDMKVNDIMLGFKIVASDNFLPGDVKSTKAALKIMDKLTMPEGWNHEWTGGKNQREDVSRYWGVYSPVKHQFMIDYSINDERWDADFLETLNKDEERMFDYRIFFAKKMEEYVELNGALYADPNDKTTVITF